MWPIKIHGAPASMPTSPTASPLAPGFNQFYRDVDNPNNVTLVLEWDEADKAQAFLNDPNTKASMDAAGVTGRPSVVAVQTKA
jgi:quinol monooxygenase YgiN